MDLMVSRMLEIMEKIGNKCGKKYGIHIEKHGMHIEEIWNTYRIIWNKYEQSVALGQATKLLQLHCRRIGHIACLHPL